MSKQRLPAVGVLIGLCLLTLSGCSFFGGDEPDYTYWEPTLSPDGSLIAYESAAESSLELFTLDLTTDSERQLTDNEHADWSPAWSPDGTQIAFASSRDENVDIYVINVVTLEVSRLTMHEADDINPSWGSDGVIYFNSNRTESWEAYTVDPESLVLRKLTSLGTSTP